MSWRNDALRKQGILPPKPPDPNDEFEEALQQAVREAEQNRLENLDLDELAELEDDEDEEFLESYRFYLAFKFSNILDKSDFRKYVTLKLGVTSAQSNPFQNQILSKKSQRRVQILGSLFTYSKTSIKPGVTNG